MDITNMRISLDPNHKDYILSEQYNLSSSPGNSLIYCFKQIMKRNKKIVKNFKNYFFWLNVTRYITFLVQKVERLCFDRLSADLTAKAFRLCYSYEELGLCQVYYQQLSEQRNLQDKVSKPAKCVYYMAKYLKKTASKKPSYRDVRNCVISA